MILISAKWNCILVLVTNSSISGIITLDRSLQCHLLNSSIFTSLLFQGKFIFQRLVRTIIELRDEKVKLWIGDNCVILVGILTISNRNGRKRNSREVR